MEETKESHDVYEELLKQLQDAHFAEVVEKSSEWEIFRRSWKDIYKIAEEQLDNCPPWESDRIAELQLCKRFYRDVLSTTLEMYKKYGKEAYQSAEQEPGLLNRIWYSLSNSRA